MLEIDTLTRKWGNSIAIIIPAKIIEQQKLKENERVMIKVERKRPIKDGIKAIY